MAVTEPDVGQRRRLPAKNGGRAERADHFVVAHVNDPQIAVVLCALAGDGHDDVRVDGGERDVDDFKIRSRIFFAQQHFEVTTRAEGRFGIAHGGRFAEDENAERAGCLVNRHPDRTGTARVFRRKKTEAEIVVLDEVIFIADPEPVKKTGVVTVAGEPQRKFQCGQQPQRQQQRRQPENPKPPFRRRAGRRAGVKRVQFLAV